MAVAKNSVLVPGTVDFIIKKPTQNKQTSVPLGTFQILHLFDHKTTPKKND